MPFLLLALVALFAVSILSDGLGREADVKLAIHQSDSNSKLVQEQGDILTRLEAKKDAKVSEFVLDWRRAYPSSSDSEKRLVLPWRGMRETTITHPHFGPEPVEVYAINVQVPSVFSSCA